MNDVPAIVVESPSFDKLPYADEDLENSNEKDDRLGDLMEKRASDDEQQCERSLRRKNSISLPNLDDMKVFSENIDTEEVSGITLITQLVLGVKSM